MKIDQSSIARLLQQQQTGATQRGNNAAGPAADNPTGSVNVTHLSQGLQDASQDIDEARVAEIRQAIADGRLQINPEKIAAGLIASLQQEGFGDS